MRKKSPFARFAKGLRRLLIIRSAYGVPPLEEPVEPVPLAPDEPLPLVPLDPPEEVPLPEDASPDAPFGVPLGLVLPVEVPERLPGCCVLPAVCTPWSLAPL
jgi:hypothetical protein